MNSHLPKAQNPKPEKPAIKHPILTLLTIVFGWIITCLMIITKINSLDDPFLKLGFAMALVVGTVFWVYLIYLIIDLWAEGI